MLALGAGVGRGEIERPIAHIDVAATTAELLGVKFQSSGRILTEIS